MLDARFLHIMIVSTLTAIVGLIPYFYRRDDITRWFAGAHTCLALWCMNEVVTFLPGSHDMRLWLFRISYVVGVLMVWNFFRFLLSLAHIPLTEFPKSWKALKILGWINIVLCFTPWLTRDISEYTHPFKEIPGLAYPIFVGFMLWGLGLPLYQLGRGYKRSSGHERTQLKYVFFASFLEFLEGVLFFASLYFPQIGHWYFYLEVLYSVTLAYTIMAHQLMDITIIIRKTLEYSVITGILAFVYLGVVVSLAYVLERMLHMKSSMASVPAVVAVTLLFHPLRLKIQAFVDRKFFRETVDSEKALGSLADQMATRKPTHELALAFLDVLQTSLHPKAMALYLRRQEADGFQLFTLENKNSWEDVMPSDNRWAHSALTDRRALAVSAEERARFQAEWVLPLEGQNELAGYLILGQKRSEVPLSDEERRFVEIALGQFAMTYEQTLLSPRWAVENPNELLADVARGFVHEIKTPLSNINLPAQATFMDLQAIEDQKRSLDVMLPKFKERMKFIMTQAVKASQRIDAIREFAALEDPRMETVDLSLPISDCVETLRPMLDVAEIQLNVKTPNGLALVQANPKHLEIVFTNLLKNAIEAIQSAQRPVKERLLTLTIARQKEKQIVSIQDAGTGIKPEDMPHVFERSFTTKGVGGTGVGLFLTRQLVESLGGKIAVQSEENKGTLFTVELPAFNPQNPKAFNSRDPQKPKS